MFAVAFIGTPKEVFAASALEDFAPHFVAGISTYFTAVDSEGDEVTEAS